MKALGIILLWIMLFLIDMVILLLAFNIDVYEIMFGRKYNATGKIKFRQFLALYTIAEFSWILDTYTVEYFDRTSGSSFTLYFSFFDTFRYISWKRNREHNEDKTKQLNEMKHVLSLMQQDIQDYCEDNQIRKL